MTMVGLVHLTTQATAISTSFKDILTSGTQNFRPRQILAMKVSLILIFAFMVDPEGSNIHQY